MHLHSYNTQLIALTMNREHIILVRHIRLWVVGLEAAVMHRDSLQALQLLCLEPGPPLLLLYLICDELDRSTTVGALDRHTYS